MDFLNFGNISRIIEQAKKHVEETKKVLSETIVEGNAGGGMVTVKMNGLREVLDIKISPELIENRDVELIESLLTAALNDAGKKATEVIKEKIGNLPGSSLLNSFLNNLHPNSEPEGNGTA